MGHAVGYGFLKATTKEAAMKEGYKDATEWAEYNVDRGENPYGDYHGNFKYYDKIFNTEDEALDFFDSLGSYRDGVCQVKEASKSHKEKLNKVKKQIAQKKEELRELCIEKFKERTSATIGCKKCGTRLTSEVALRNKLCCPNCRNWLVSDTVKTKMNKYDEKLKQAEELFNKQVAETGKPRYWAKYEVHC